MEEHQFRCPTCRRNHGRFLDRPVEELDVFCDYCREQVLAAERELIAYCEKKVHPQFCELTPAQIKKIAGAVWDDPFKAIY